MIRRKSPSEGTSRGFSFDLVSRRKNNEDDDHKVRSPLELLTDSQTEPAPTPPADTSEQTAEARAAAEAIAAIAATAEKAERAAAELAPKPVSRAEPVAAPEPAVEPEEAPLFLSEPVTTPPAAPAEAEATPAPARRTSRVKTTFLGFERSDGRIEDIFAEGQSKKEAAAPSSAVMFPVGWLAITKGPGRGKQISLHAGVSQIGRGDTQSVQIDFGDSGISRENHAAIAFDDEEGKFFLGHGGKANIVRLNGKPVLSTEELTSGDDIRISETTLRFVALCGEDFTWAEDE